MNVHNIRFLHTDPNGHLLVCVQGHYFVAQTADSQPIVQFDAYEVSHIYVVVASTVYNFFSHCCVLNLKSIDSTFWRGENQLSLSSLLHYTRDLALGLG